MSSSSHTTSPVDVSPHSEVLTGIRLGLPILIGYVPLGIAYGVLAVKNGIPAMWAVAMSVFVFAGAGQFIAAGMIGGGASIPAVALANLMVNLRHILMSAALTYSLCRPPCAPCTRPGSRTNFSPCKWLIFAAARRAADGGFLPAI